MKDLDYQDLMEKISKILFEEDPIGINFEENTDEYDTEARTIVPRLGNSKSIEDIQQILHEEFCRWFDEKTAGEISRYRRIAERIWTLIAVR